MLDERKGLHYACISETANVQNQELNADHQRLIEYEPDRFYECVENMEDYVYEDCTPEELETLQPVHIMSNADVDAMLPSATTGLDTSCEGELGSIPFGAIIAANATVQHDQSEFQAFPADTSQPKPFQDLPTMFKAMDTPKEMQRAINDIKTGRVKGKHDLLTFTNKKIDLLLNPDIDAATLMASNIPLNDSIIEAINKEEEFVDRGNLGDDLSILTAIIAILNYSVLDDMGKGRGRYGHGMVNLLNGCIMFLLKFIVRWIIGENTGKKCKDVTLDSAGVYDIFFMAFDNLDGSVAEYNRITKRISGVFEMTRPQAYAINYINMCLAIKLFMLVNPGRVVSLMTFTSHGRKHFFADSIVESTSAIKDWGDGVHPMAWLMFTYPFLFKDERKVKINEGLAGFFGYSREVQQYCGSPNTITTKMAHDYGAKYLTPEQIALRMKAMEKNMKAFKLQRNMSQLAKVVARKTGDHTLSNLVSNRVDISSLVLPQYKEEYGNALASCDGDESVLRSTLADKRQWQIEQYKGSALNKLNDEWAEGDNPIILHALEKCNEYGLTDKFGKPPTPTNAITLHRQYVAFMKHLPVIQLLAKDRRNWVNIGKGGGGVFHFSTGGENQQYVGTYGYINNKLQYASENDFRRKKLIEKYELNLRLDEWSTVKSEIHRKASNQLVSQAKEIQDIQLTNVMVGTQCKTVDALFALV